MPDNSEVLARQAPLNLALPDSVHIIGCGGVGSWVALFLALARCPVLHLWDGDTVTESNLNRLPLSPDALGSPKAFALAQAIRRFVPTGVDITPRLRWSEADADLLPFAQSETSNHWLVGATDTWESRRRIYAYARAKAVHYIEVSADGEFGGCTGSPADFVTPDEANPGYASVPVHVGPCAAAASMAVYYLLHDRDCGPANYRIGWNGSSVVMQHPAEAPCSKP